MNVKNFEWTKLTDASSDIIGARIQLMHWSGATEMVTIESKAQALTALKNGYTKYRRIAASPELYEALEYAMPVLELALVKGHPGAESAVKVARAALTKARVRPHD